MKDIIEHPDYLVSIKDIELFIRKGVFSPDPKITNSTSILLNNLPDVKDKEVLDVGCGSGIISIYCFKKGAKNVVSSDVDDKALSNTKENMIRNNIKDFKIIKSYLFENISGKFDYIFGNLPIDDKAWNLKITTADLLKDFITKSKDHINKNGCIYFTWFGEDSFNKLISYLKDNHYNHSIKKEKKLGRVWYLVTIQY